MRSEIAPQTEKEVVPPRPAKRRNGMPDDALAENPTANQRRLIAKLSQLVQENLDRPSGGQADEHHSKR